MSVVGIVLAAGASRRMGRPKALLEVDGRTLLAAHVAALGAVCDEVIAVVRPELPSPPGARRVENGAPDAAMIDSLALALRGVTADRAVITPVDVPPAAPATLARLLAAGGTAVPTYAGRPGHPVVLDRDRIAAIAAEPPAGGLRTALGDAARVPVEDPDTTLDFDDPPAWEAWRARRG